MAGSGGLQAPAAAPSGRTSALGFVSSLFGVSKPQPQQQQQQQMTGYGPAGSDFVTTQSNNPSTTAAAGGTSSSFAQKFGAFTHAGGGNNGQQPTTMGPASGEPSAVDSLVSKGKELIFKKFGLGS
jgi:hypothetical protein